MKLSNYTLEIAKKTLLKQTDVVFKKGEINYILGENGIGKSVFAKSLFHKHDNISTNFPSLLYLFSCIILLIFYFRFYFYIFSAVII